MAKNNNNDIAYAFQSLSIKNNQDETGKYWRNKSSRFFNAEMVVYEILCTCGCIYYGETSNSLRVALDEIESKIRNKSPKKRRVEEHFGPGKCNFDDAFITLKDYEECTDTRRQIKRDYKMKCSKSKSLNTQTPRKRDINPHNLKQEKLEK